MRLICPNCDAQYEVPIDAIPTEGRDVQCSNCGQTWFQHHPDHIPTDEAEDDIAPLAQDPEPIENEEHPKVEPEAPRRKLDPAVADILRQEAEYEAQARARTSAPLESQPDLGLDDGEEAEINRSAHHAREQVEHTPGQGAAAPREMATTAPIRSRRDLLPDIEEINSTLRSTGDRQNAANGTTAIAPEKAHKKRSFRRGFFSAIIIAALLAALYIFAPTIAKTAPQADPMLSRYVGFVDKGRSWLDGQITALLKWLDETAAAQQSQKTAGHED